MYSWNDSQNSSPKFSMDRLKGIMAENRVLVTGSGGFAGSAVTRVLLSHGVEVVGLYHTNPPRNTKGTFKAGQARFVQGDLSKDFEIPAGINAVVHTAGQASPVGKLVSDYVENNIRATQNLVEFSVKAGVKKFVNFSSMSVYGKIDTSIVDEGTEIVNPSPYGLSKYLAEAIVEEAAAQMGSVSIRLPGIVGEGAKGPWLSKVFQRARTNDDIEIFNADSLFNNVVHIEDLCEFVVSLLAQDLHHAEVLTIASGNPMTTYETVKHIRGLCDSTSSIKTNSDGARSFIISNKKAEEKFGYRPTPLRRVLEMFAGENLSNG